MDIAQILEEANKIFIRVLDNEDIVLTAQTTAKDIPDWDSLMHIQLIVAVEKFFKIKFTSLEIRNFKNVGDMCEIIRQRLG